MPHRVFHVGPTPRTQGGIASVLHTYRAHWDETRGTFRWVGIFEDGALWYRLWVFARGWLVVLYVLLTWRPHAVHLHFTWRGSFFRHVIIAGTAQAFGCTVVMHSHGSRMHRFYDELPGWGRRFFLWVLNHADALIVLAPHWERFYQGIGVRTRLYVIPNPVQLAPPPAADRQSGLRVLMLGRLTEHKGTYDLLAALPAVMACCPGAEFWLCGDGDVTQVRDYLRGTPYAAQVHVPGWIDADEKRRQLAAANVLLHPSHAEGLPVAVLEAMAAGLPVVGTGVGGMEDLVLDGITGLRVGVGDVEGLADALCKLCHDLGQRAALGAAGRALIERRYRVESVMPLVYDLYDDVCGLQKSGEQS